MKVAILGTGIVGQILAGKLNQLGHEVVIGTRDVEKTLANDQPGTYGNPPLKDWFKENKGVGLKSFSDTAAFGEIIFNCTSGMVSLNALKLAGTENLNGKILVDVANPLDFSQGMPPSLNPVNTDSLGEQIQKAYPEVKVIKALNTMNGYLMVNPSMLKGDHNVFVCGNDEDAKSQVTELLSSFGWRKELVIDLGDISNARGTEMLLPIWLRLWGKLGTGEFNFYIQKN